MIPKIVHQTWKSAQIPAEFEGYARSWEAQNPGWKRILWSDRMLLDFVAEQYPDFLPIFTGYPNGVMRADAGRYLLLHHFGGVYADLDCECLQPLEPLVRENRIVISKEPAAHFAHEAAWRGQPYLLFNGTIACPPNHPFWPHLMGYLRRNGRNSKSILDITGPSILTAAQMDFGDQSAFRIEGEEVFCPYDKTGVGAPSVNTLSAHHWAGTWWSPRPTANLGDKLKTAVLKTAYHLSRGAQYDAQAVLRAVSPLAQTPLPPKDGNVAVFIPVRNAAEHIAPLGKLLSALDYPLERLRIVFCEGDSTDDTAAELKAFQAHYSAVFYDVTILHHQVGNSIPSALRHKRRHQRKRRGHIAQVRNHLIAQGLRDSDDWVLWLDADVCAFEPDILTQLLNAESKIVVPDCTRVPDGPSYDMNSFAERNLVKDFRYYRYMRGGLYQPPAGTFSRYHLHDLRHLSKVRLRGVGGTMLLVEAALHRAGLIFPEQPYEDLIETEAFGALAAACGIDPVGLPRAQIRHVPW